MESACSLAYLTLVQLRERSITLDNKLCRRFDGDLKPLKNCCLKILIKGLTNPLISRLIGLIICQYMDSGWEKGKYPILTVGFNQNIALDVPIPSSRGMIEFQHSGYTDYYSCNFRSKISNYRRYECIRKDDKCVYRTEATEFQGLTVYIGVFPIVSDMLADFVTHEEKVEECSYCLTELRRDVEIGSLHPSV